MKSLNDALKRSPILITHAHSWADNLIVGFIFNAGFPSGRFLILPGFFSFSNSITGVG